MPSFATFLNWRLPVLIFGLIVAAAFAAGAGNLWVNSSYKVFFDETNPQRLAYETIERSYTKSDELLFVVSSVSGNMFTRDNLSALEVLTTEAWKLPRVIRVDSLINFQNSIGSVDGISVSRLVENAESLDVAQISRVRALALSEPLLKGALVSASGNVAAVSVRMQMPDDPKEYEAVNNQVVDAAYSLQERVKASNPDLVFHLVGQIPTTYAFANIAKADAGQFVPMMLGIIALTMMVMLRSLVAAVTVIFVILLSVAATMGFAGWVGYQLNQVNAAAPTIIITLAVADCMHLIVDYLERLRTTPDRVQAMTEVLSEDIAPLLMTSVTVAIGFFTLIASESPPFRQLGVIVGTGVMLTFVFTVLIVPPILTWVPLKPRQIAGSQINFAALAGRIVDRNRLWMWGALLTVAFFVAFIPKNDLNDDTVHYFGEKLPIRQAFDFTESNLAGIDSIEFSLSSGKENGIYEPHFLKHADSFAQWLRTQPNVTYVGTFTDVVKRLNRNLNSDDPAAFVIPADREQIAQIVLLYELSLPQGLDLSQLVTFDKASTRISVRLSGVQSSDLLALESAAYKWMSAEFPDAQLTGSSPSLMFAHIGQKNIDSILQGAAFGVLLIFVVMALMFRSVKFGVVAVIANTLPAAVAFGIWALIDGRVNLAVAAIFNISSGIVIDDTIHLINHYLRARRNHNQPPREAVRHAYGSVGIVVLANTLVLALGFAVFAGSDFTVNRSLGIMTAIIIVLAALYDLIMLPGLLLTAERIGSKKQLAEGVA